MTIKRKIPPLTPTNISFLSVLPSLHSVSSSIIMICFFPSCVSRSSWFKKKNLCNLRNPRIIISAYSCSLVVPWAVIPRFSSEAQAKNKKMKSKANFKNAGINATPCDRIAYGDLGCKVHQKSKPNTNPKQSQSKPNSKILHSLGDGEQTQFQGRFRGCLSVSANSSKYRILRQILFEEYYLRAIGGVYSLITLIYHRIANGKIRNAPIRSEYFKRFPSVNSVPHFNHTTPIFLLFQNIAYESRIGMRTALFNVVIIRFDGALHKALRITAVGDTAEHFKPFSPAKDFSVDDLPVK